MEWFAAIIAAFTGALIGGWMASRNQVQSFRQQWIDSLRTLFSSFIAEADRRRWEKIDREKAEKVITKETKREDLHLLLVHSQLHINPEDEQEMGIVERMKALEEILVSGEEDKPVFVTTRNELVSSMHGLLKKEWNRTRDGDCVWRIKRGMGIYRKKKVFIDAI